MKIKTNFSIPRANAGAVSLGIGAGLLLLILAGLLALVDQGAEWRESTRSAQGGAPSSAPAFQGDVQAGEAVEAQTQTQTPTASPDTSIESERPQALLVLNSEPRDGAEEIHGDWKDMLIAVQFDRPVVPLTGVDETLDAANPLRFEPVIEGEGEWLNTDTFRFRPSKNLRAGKRYTVTIAAGLRAIDGSQLEEDHRFSFSTRRPYVVQFGPKNRVGQTEFLAYQDHVHSQGEASDSELDAGPAAESKSKSNSDPDSESDSESWSRSRSKPAAQSGPQSTTKSATATTEASSVKPLPSDALYMPSQHIPVTSSITVDFSQAMDVTSAEAAFTMRPLSQNELRSQAQSTDRAPTPSAEARETLSNTFLAGTFQWPSPERLMFKPDAPLERGQAYIVRIDESALAESGHTGLDHATTWHFYTSRDFAVDWSYPENGMSVPADKFGRSVKFDFSAPVDPETVDIRIQPTITNPSLVGLDNSGRRLHFGTGWQASTAYTVSLLSGTRSLEGELLETPRVLRFKVGPISPRYRFLVPGQVGVYSAHRTPITFFSGINTGDKSIRLRVSKIDPISLARYLHGRDRATLVGETEVRDTLELETPVNEWNTVAWNPSGRAEESLPPGAYQVVAAGPSPNEHFKTQRHLMIVADVNLVMKRSARELLVWATRTIDGRPAADIDIRIVDENGQIRMRGRTDADGLYRSKAPTHFSKRFSEFNFLLALAESDGVLCGISVSHWSQGIQSHDYQLPFASSVPKYRFHVYTERPIYRPGQEVHFKGIVRSDDGNANYSLPASKTLRIHIEDSRGREVFNTVSAPNEFGSFDGTLQLDEDAVLGDYRLTVLVQGLQNDDHWRPDGGRRTSFKVAAYRKPEFKLDIDFDSSTLISGDELSAELSAEYYFGGVVSRAKGTWRLLVEDMSAPILDLPGRWAWFDPESWACRGGCMGALLLL